MASRPRWCTTEEEARARDILGGATVLFLEDIDLTRRTFCRYFGDAFRVLEAASVDEGISAGCRALPGLDVVIADLGLPDGSGWEVIATLHARDPTLRFLVVSMLEDTEPPKGTSARLLKKILFVDKPTSAAELLAVAAYAYHLVGQDRRARRSATGSSSDQMLTVVDPLPKREIERRPQHPALSYRESQAMRGCTMGLTNQEIADQLGIALATARKHVCAGLEKLKIESRRQVRWALERDRDAEEHQ